MRKLRVQKLLDWYVHVFNQILLHNNYCNVQVFANAVIGNAGLIIVPFMVALATFSSAHVSLLSQSR